MSGKVGSNKNGPGDGLAEAEARLRETPKLYLICHNAATIFKRGHPFISKGTSAHGKGPVPTRLGVLVAFTARREGSAPNELLRYAQEAVAEFTKEAMTQTEA